MIKLSPLVSIIIPCFNQGQYLNEALHSIMNQTYSNWECIIVNDGSQDNTDELAKNWNKRDERFRYIKKEKGGPSAARNTGLKIAKGEYIQFLDADDILECNKIGHQINYLNSTTNSIDIFVSGYRYFINADKLRELQIFGPSNLLPEVVINMEDKHDIQRLFAKKNPLVISAALYHMRVFDKVGLFDEELRAFEDWDFHFRCALKGIVFQHTGYFPDTKTIIRLHEESAMYDNQLLNKQMQKFRLKHRNNPIFANKYSKFDMLDLSYSYSFINKILITIKLFTPPIFIQLIKRVIK